MVDGDEHDEDHALDISAPDAGDEETADLAPPTR